MTRAEAKCADLVAEMVQSRPAVAGRDFDDVFMHERVGEIHADLIRERIGGHLNKLCNLTTEGLAAAHVWPKPPLLSATWLTSILP